MKQSCALFGITVGLLLFASCGSKEAAVANGPQATVILRDGTRFSGVVTSSSPASVSIAGEGNNSRTFDMKDVKAVEYGEPVSVPQTEPRPTSAAAPAAARPQKPASAPPVERYHPAESVIKTRTNVLPAGTQLSVRTDETIDAKKAVDGQAFAAEIAQDVLDADGDLVIPRGSNAQIVIRSITKGGKIKGSTDLVLDLDSVSVDGRKYQLDTTDLNKDGKDGLGKNKRTAKYVGSGAAVGAVIGAIFGQGKGAAIGAASGAAAGAATQVVTRGAIRVPAETVLTFQLDKPLRVVAANR
jgi:hypothetical protein